MSLYDIIREKIRGTILNSLSEYPSTEVIYAHSSGTQPNNTYCTIYVMAFDQIGRVTQSSRLSPELEQEFSAPYEISVQVSFFGKEAPSQCLSSYFRLANAVLNREYSQTYNLSITDKTQIRRVPRKDDTKWTDMCSFDLTFLFIGSFKQTIGAINQVVYEDPITEVVIAIPPTITP